MRHRIYLLLISLIIIWSGVQGAERPLLTAKSLADNTPTTLYLPLVFNSPVDRPVVRLKYGVNFINSAEDPADAQQFQNGLSTGARWNRWPIYWHLIETSVGVFDWSRQDTAVLGDIAHGFKTNAILLGTPGFYLTRPVAELNEPSPPRYGALALSRTAAATPQGLYEPIFTDGDAPGVGKTINPANKWAIFVFQAVNRYKPGGLLAQAHGWGAGVGITYWEMWNEPDLTMFWDGTLPDYARLLKVGYLAAKQADPAAKIIFAGLANNPDQINYYRDVLTIYQADSLAAQHNYFHDIFATHSYFYSWNSWYHVYRAKNTQGAFGFSTPIWLNETGVAAWDDYPGPVWDSQSSYRATLPEQANYTIQTAFYAAYAGAEAIFHFQLYDGCGNQPQNSDFPPHHGELCNGEGMLISDPTKPCAGDANGLFRNPTDAACFRQHPQPETPRLNLAAYQVVTTYLQDVQPYWRQRPGGDDPYNGTQEWIAFYKPSTGQRIVGLWARVNTPQTAVIAATSPTQQATLVYRDGRTESITAVNGRYTIPLPAATNQNAPWDPTLYAIGGEPVILVETDRR